MRPFTDVQKQLLDDGITAENKVEIARAFSSGQGFIKGARETIESVIRELQKETTAHGRNSLDINEIANALTRVNCEIVESNEELRKYNSTNVGAMGEIYPSLKSHFDHEYVIKKLKGEA